MVPGGGSASVSWWPARPLPNTVRARKAEEVPRRRAGAGLAARRGERPRPHLRPPTPARESGRFIDLQRLPELKIIGPGW